MEALFSYSPLNYLPSLDLYEEDRPFSHIVIHQPLESLIHQWITDIYQRGKVVIDTSLMFIPQITQIAQIKSQYKASDVCNLIINSIKIICQQQRQVLDNCHRIAVQEKNKVCDIRDSNNSWFKNYDKYSSKDQPSSVYSVLGQLLSSYYRYLSIANAQAISLWKILFAQCRYKDVNNRYFEQHIYNTILTEMTAPTVQFNPQCIFPTLSITQKYNFVFISIWGFEQRKKLAKYEADDENAYTITRISDNLSVSSFELLQERLNYKKKNKGEHIKNFIQQTFGENETTTFNSIFDEAIKNKMELINDIYGEKPSQKHLSPFDFLLPNFNVLENQWKQQSKKSENQIEQHKPSDISINQKSNEVLLNSGPKVKVPTEEISNAKQLQQLCTQKQQQVQQISIKAAFQKIKSQDQFVKFAQTYQNFKKDIGSTIQYGEYLILINNDTEDREKEIILQRNRSEKDIEKLHSKFNQIEDKGIKQKNEKDITDKKASQPSIKIKEAKINSEDSKHIKNKQEKQIKLIKNLNDISINKQIQSFSKNNSQKLNTYQVREGKQGINKYKRQIDEIKIKDQIRIISTQQKNEIDVMKEKKKKKKNKNKKKKKNKKLQINENKSDNQDSSNDDKNVKQILCEQEKNLLQLIQSLQIDDCLRVDCNVEQRMKQHWRSKCNFYRFKNELNANNRRSQYKNEIIKNKQKKSKDKSPKAK